MAYILVTFNYPGSNSVDLKIPDSLTANEFIGIMRETFGVKGTALQAEPLGIQLNNGRSLAEQKVEHGAALTLLDGI